MGRDGGDEHVGTKAKMEASYQRLSVRTRLGLVSSARPFCLAFFGRTGTVEEVPRRAAATTLTPFMQL